MSEKDSGSQGRYKRGLKRFDSELQKIWDEKVGEPVFGDPLEITIWQQKVAAFATLAYAKGQINQDQKDRLRGMLEAIRTGGMVAVKAQERKKQREIAKRLGVVKDNDDGLEDFRRAPAVVE